MCRKSATEGVSQERDENGGARPPTERIAGVPVVAYLLIMLKFLQRRSRARYERGCDEELGELTLCGVVVGKERSRLARKIYRIGARGSH